MTIVELCEKDQIEAARRGVDDVAHHLARHRIKAEVGRSSIAGIRRNRTFGLAEDEGADLLVTGAYGHSQLNEWVFGGMTRDLLVLQFDLLPDVPLMRRVVRVHQYQVNGMFLNQHRLRGNGIPLRLKRPTKPRA